MLQYAFKITIPRRHVELSVAIETSHSAGVPHLLARLRLRPGPLLAVVVAAGSSLAALVRLLDSPILLSVFSPVSNQIVRALAIVP
jgi:hypothetical protein